MNLLDVVKQGKEIKNEVYALEGIIEATQKSIKPLEVWMTFNMELLLNKPISGGANQAISNANLLKENTRNSYQACLNSFRNINFKDLYFTVAKLKGKEYLFNLEKFLDLLIEFSEEVHAFTAYSGTEKVSSILMKVYLKSNEVIHEYNSIINNINQLDNLSTKLNSVSDEDVTLKIRLMNENDNVNSLIRNITLINEIYTTINKLVGDESEELRFGRLESGSLTLEIAGCIIALKTMQPLLEFAYKIYSEQFSRKARLENDLLELEVEERKKKVRGDYLRLIKENTGSELSNVSSDEVNDALAKLEDNIEELYSKNPYIILGEEAIGLEGMKDNVIPFKRLKEGIEE